mmetsp:Transcript_32138/g.31450  ORF Transcript_32138/g.31450 Transcript_32138/m.31450 type:complete len:217 (-) Transcript_32138:1071-1721(-)
MSIFLTSSFISSRDRFLSTFAFMNFAKKLMLIYSLTFPLSLFCLDCFLVAINFSRSFLALSLFCFRKIASRIPIAFNGTCCLESSKVLRMEFSPICPFRSLSTILMYLSKSFPCTGKLNCLRTFRSLSLLIFPSLWLSTCSNFSFKGWRRSLLMMKLLIFFSIFLLKSTVSQCCPDTLVTKWSTGILFSEFRRDSNKAFSCSYERVGSIFRMHSLN